jgi:small subunit ribosomal protein S33
MRPPSTILRSLAEVQAKVFQTTPPRPLGEPSSVRTGAKFLRKRLVGPSMLKYYPPTLSIKTVNSFLTAPGMPLHRKTWQAPDGTKRRGLIHSKELQRLEDVERKKAIGKGPPKKGELILFVLRIGTGKY